MGINFLVISFVLRYQTLHFWVVVRAEPNVKGSVVVVVVFVVVFVAVFVVVIVVWHFIVPANTNNKIVTISCILIFLTLCLSCQ